MKFGDKLILLRKKKGMNQEELAEKLGVSRQSVSKWESNNSYPETDKIVQICNIFNCSMDDLINDSITDINEIQRKDKNNLSIAIDSFLEFITKTINMFASMKFSSGLKCIIEMIILTFILALTGKIICGILSSSIANLFSFLDGYVLIRNVTNSLFLIIWIIIEAIILIHTFKIRYLNYYDKVSNKTEETPIIENNDKKQEKKKETVIIRDDKHAPFAFLSVLSSIVIIFAKIILAGFALELIVALISAAIMLVFSIFLTSISTLFLGIDISLLSFIIINVILLVFITAFIFNKKVKFKSMIITLLVSIIFIGVGIGISVISFKDFEITDEAQYTKTSKEVIDYKDNMVIVASRLPDTEYKIDNSINNIEVEISYNDRLSVYNIKEDTYYGLNTYEIHEISRNTNLKDAYDVVIPDLKKKKIRTNYDAIKIKITANEETINKLIENSSKAYVFDKEEIDGGYILKNISHKIQKQDFCTEKTEYNAVTGEIITSGNCKCNIKEDNNYLIFNCDYEE